MFSESLIPKDLEWLFPEYDFNAMDLKTHQGVIIERILERGNWEQVRWLFQIYNEASIKNWVCLHGFRLLSRRSFSLWRLALDIQEYQAPTWAQEAKAMEVW